MKGQMFLILTVIIVSGLLIVKATSLAPEILEAKKVSELTLETKIHANILEELKKAAKISADEKENITTNVFDFANFIKRKMDEKFLDFKFFFVGSIARTNGIMNTSVVNLMGEQKNVSLQLNGMIRNSLVDDNQRWNTSFDISPGTTYTLIVSFTNYTENVTIKTKANKDVYTAFFDVYLQTDNTIHRSKTDERYQ